MKNLHRETTRRIPLGVLTITAVFSLMQIAAAAHAQPILINFEQIPAMSNSVGTAIPSASRLADQYLATHGVRFSSGSPFVAVVNHGTPTPSPPNIIGGSTPTGLLTYQQAFPLDVRFLDATGTQPRVVTVVTVRGDLTPVSGTKTLQAFDLSGVMIDSQTLQDSNVAPLMVSSAPGGPGIHRVRMFSSSATIGFDDLRFDTPVPPPSPCPADITEVGGTAEFPGNPDGQLTVDDIIVFVNLFSDATGCPGTPGIPCSRADVCGVGGPPEAPDGQLTVDDIIAFINAFSDGC